jgi:hypothetical protein
MSLNSVSIGCESNRAIGPCPYDLNGDLVISNTDLLLFLMVYGLEGEYEEDFNSDGMVNVPDFNELMAAVYVGCN